MPALAILKAIIWKYKPNEKKIPIAIKNNIE